ncbi:Fc.00g027820.m01.CDS01 [Cosmosporella sp. VM-42]
MDLQATWQALKQSFIDNVEEPLPLALAVAAITILITTRFLSGGFSTYENGTKTPLLAPYWIPYFGHVPRIAFNPSSALSKLRDRYLEGIFSIRLFNNVHTLVNRPSLSATLLQQSTSVADEQFIVRRLMVTNFGLSKNDLAAYDRACAEVQEKNEELINFPTTPLPEMMKNLTNQLADLVTFNSYPVDQMEWERLAHAEVIEDNGKGETVMEADLMNLTRNFVVKPAAAAIFGTDFVENFPEIWPFLWTFDEGFATLALNPPIWLPWPRAQKARNARRKLEDFMYEFHTAMEKDMNGDDPGPRWYDLHNVSSLVKSRTEVFRKHKLSLEVRAAYDVSLLWSLNAHSTSIISWSLLELYKDPVLLEQVRDEIGPFVKVVQPENDFGGAVWVPPKIETLNMEALLKQCPLLNAVCLESVRLYGGGWSTRWLKEDVILGADDKKNSKYVLKKGTYAHVSRDLHYLDPKRYPDPKNWLLKRHLETDSPPTNDIDPVTMYDGSLTMCDDHRFTLLKMLTFVSLLISLYEIQPPGSKSWSLPRISRGAISSWPTSPIRVWIKRREFAKPE